MNRTVASITANAVVRHEETGDDSYDSEQEESHREWDLLHRRSITDGVRRPNH